LVHFSASKLQQHCQHVPVYLLLHSQNLGYLQQQ
jgi:hypothetical protein